MSTTLFISYSHTDKDWLRRVQAHLNPLLRDVEVSVWDDGRIKPGDVWPEEIDKALSAARVAVLLVSRDFFASDFIMNVEWPRLKAAADGKRLRILWIAVGASVLTETAIGEYQGLNDPNRPLATFSPADQDVQLVQICKKIKETLFREPEGHDTHQPTGAEVGPSTLSPVRVFDAQIGRITTCAVDARRRLWVSNGQQVKTFEIRRNEFMELWLLPNRRWKHHLGEIWRDHLLVSDWDGSLYQFNGQDRDGDKPLYQARDDDLPIHRLAVGRDGQLVAAAWNGVIRMWNQHGEPAGRDPLLVASHLPIHLIPLADGSIALADQANFLRLYDASGRETWCWRADGVIHAAWAYEQRGQWAFLAQVGRRRLLKLVPGKPTEPEQEHFDTPVVTISRRRGSAFDPWAVIARAGGKIDWLSASPFGVARDNSVTTKFEIRDILAVYDSARPASLLALGITREGCLFTLQDREVREYPELDCLERVVLDPEGPFIFGLRDNRVLMFQNPVIQPASCSVTLVSVTGTLAVNAFHKVTVTLKNSGRIVIVDASAELYAEGLIDSCKNTRALAAPASPGETFVLEFSVRARAAGQNVPLRLKVKMADEKGPSASDVEIGFDIESRPS
jgi:hypothetical protein